MGPGDPGGLYRLWWGNSWARSDTACQAPPAGWEDWLHDRPSLLSPSPDCRGVARGPAQSPVPLPGLRGGHNGVYDAWCHPPPVFSKLQWQEGTGSHQQREVGIGGQATRGLIGPSRPSLLNPPSFSKMLPSSSQETWDGWQWGLKDQVPPP